jgi:exosortase/archaeosortase family protein
VTIKDQWRAAMAILTGLVLLVLVLSGAAAPLLAWPTQVTADLTVTGLSALGISHLQHGTVLFQADGFAYEIYYRCIGCVPVIVLATGIVAWPASIGERLVGLCIGIPLLLGLNIVRLLHLFSIGVNHPEHFWLAHRVLWESVMLLTVLLAWALWVRWVAGRPRETIARSYGPTT